MNLWAVWASACLAVLCAVGYAVRAARHIQDPAMYEGAEKTLRVVFCMTGAEAGAEDSLLSVPRREWERVLSPSGTAILSEAPLQSPGWTAYLLSESSLFVSPHEVIIKTCGESDILAVVPRLIQAAAHAPIASIVYGHKTFAYPHKQEPPYSDSFDAEVQTLLDTLAALGVGADGLDRSSVSRWGHGGSAYWEFQGVWAGRSEPGERDTHASSRVELMMDTADPAALARFTHGGSGAVELADTAGSGDFVFEAHHFQPMGYSYNAVDKSSTAYATVHVTPELSHPYVSLETNSQSTSSVAQAVAAVLAEFSPSTAVLVASGDCAAVLELDKIVPHGYTAQRVPMTLQAGTVSSDESVSHVVRLERAAAVPKLANCQQ